MGRPRGAREAYREVAVEITKRRLLRNEYGRTELSGEFVECHATQTLGKARLRSLRWQDKDAAINPASRLGEPIGASIHGEPSARLR